MNPKVKYLGLTYLLMWVVIFVLPFFSLESYSILQNTTSHLGAQSTPNSWIMNVVFAALGLTTIHAAWDYLGKYLFHKIVLVVFGLSLVGAAIFQHAPIEAGLPADLNEDLWHSRFASLTGLSFTLFAIASAFILEKKEDRVLAILLGVLATLLSFLMFNVEHLMGLWQRGIFIFCFGWLLYLFSRFRFEE